MTREESIKWIDEEIRWENECQSKHPIKEALYEARKALEQKPCKDAVSRAEVKKIAKEMYLEVASMELDAKTISDCISCTSSKCREVLERKLQALNSVTPQKPRKGHWEVVSDGYSDNAYICECSECKDTVWVYKDADRKWNYCPNCGADMREV